MPEPMKFPCLVEIPKFNALFVMGSSSVTNATQMAYYLYHTIEEKWTDITEKNSYEHMSGNKYSCSVLRNESVIISTLTNNGNVMTSLFSLVSSTWMRIDSKINMMAISHVQLLRSENMNFVTMLASSRAANLTFIYQVCSEVSPTELMTFVFLLSYKSYSRLRLIEPTRDRTFLALISGVSYYPAGIFIKKIQIYFK